MIKGLLSPSWLSATIAILAGLALSVGVILFHKIDPNHVYQQLLTLRGTPKQPVLTLPGQTVVAGRNTLETTWPLLGFWGLVGLIVYFAVETVMKIVHDASDLKKGMKYVHSRPNQILRTTAEYLILRIIGAVLWLICFNIMLKTIIPYALTLSSNAETASLAPAIIDLVKAFILVAVFVQLQAVFLRLALRKVRVFNNTAYMMTHHLS
jgi:hypothetical protein